MVIPMTIHIFACSPPCAFPLVTATPVSVQCSSWRRGVVDSLPSPWRESRCVPPYHTLLGDSVPTSPVIIMRTSACIVFAAAVACVVLGVAAVDRSKFRTCHDASFCRRHRNVDITSTVRVHVGVNANTTFVMCGKLLG